jgi:hypothetical protein
LNSHFIKEAYGALSHRHHAAALQHQYTIFSLSRLDFNGIKEHIFFKKTKWNDILTALPPFVPELRSIDDVSHFDYEDLAPSR